MQNEQDKSLHSAWVCPMVVVGNPAAPRVGLSPLYLRGKPTHACSLQVESRFPRALLFIPAVLQPTIRGDLFPPEKDPRTGAPSLWPSLLTPQGECPPVSSPLSSEVPPARSIGSDLIAYFPFYPLCVYFSYSLGVFLPASS